MVERGMYISVFYFLCYVKEISTDMLEEQVSDERDPDLNEAEDIRMEDISEERWRDIADYGEGKINIHALMWYVYTIEKEELIKI